VIRALALATVSVGLLTAGCGGDSSGETTAPALSVPPVTSPIAPETTAPAAATTPKGTTRRTPSTTTGGKNYNPKLPDSATNDVPPPPGSPQETFEKQCEQNPQACG
jgi:hypothetical protein